MSTVRLLWESYVAAYSIPNHPPHHIPKPGETGGGWRLLLPPLPLCTYMRISSWKFCYPTLLVNTVHNGAPGVYKPAYVHCRVVTLTRPASILAVGAARRHGDGPEFSHHPIDIYLHATYRYSTNNL